MATSNHVDPISNPSTGILVATSTSGGVEAICDLNPSGSKDLIKVVKHRGWPSDTWYLQVSTDNGASWSYLTASSGTPPEIDTDSGYRCLRICQDTSSYAIHVISAATLATVTQYQRITLGYTANHVTSWSWAASDITGPDFANYNGWGGGANIYEVIDGNSVHRLLVVLNEYVSATRIKQLVAAVTTPSAGLAPTGAASWCKITDYTATSARDILADYNTDTNTESLSAKHYTSQPSGNSSRAGDCGTFQLSNGDLHVFTGCVYGNGQPIDTGAVSRWRYTVSGSNWVADANAVGLDIAPVSGMSYASPCIGGTCTNSAKSIGYISYWRHNGLHIDSVNTAGTWTVDVVSQPDNGNGPGSYAPISNNWIWGWSAIGCDSNGTLYVSYDRSYGFNGHALNDLQQEGYYDGSQWQLTDTTSQWATADGWGSTTDGATTWAAIAGIDGVGVIAYPYAQVYSDPYFSSHVLLADAGAPAAELDGSSTSSTSGTGALSTAIPMLGGAVSTCLGVAALTTAIVLGASATSSCVGSGALSTGILLLGSATSQTSGTGNVTTGIPLFGDSESQSVGTGSLSTEVVLTTNGLSDTNGSADLGTQIYLLGSTETNSVGSGVLQNQIVLAANGTSGSLAFGDLATGILLLGSSESQTLGTGDLDVSGAISFNGSGVSESSASGTLDTGILLLGSSTSNGVGSGSLETNVLLVANGLSSTYGSVTLSTQILLLGSTESYGTGLGTITSVEPIAPGIEIVLATGPIAALLPIGSMVVAHSIGPMVVAHSIGPITAPLTIGPMRVVVPMVERN